MANNESGADHLQHMSTGGMEISGGGARIDGGLDRLHVPVVMDWSPPRRVAGFKGRRDRACSRYLLACGLRRHEAVNLTSDHLQQREEHWAIVDLIGKGGHVRTVPVADWVRSELEEWLAAAGIDRVPFPRVLPSHS